MAELLLCLSRNENGNDIFAMTAFVEIFQVQSIVCNLVYSVPLMDRGADFVFDDINNARNKKDYVGSPPHPGNCKFKKDVIVKEITELIFEISNLLNPSIFLLEIKAKECLFVSSPRI